MVKLPAEVETEASVLWACELRPPIRWRLRAKARAHRKEMAELLGHPSVQITLDHYSHVMPGRRRPSPIEWITPAETPRPGTPPVTAVTGS